MTKLETILNVIDHYKYLITILVGLCVVGFLSDNSFVNLMKLSMKKSDLQEEIQIYKEQNERAQEELKTLKHDKNTVEKVARERYFMKKADEDIFVLSTEMN